MNASGLDGAVIVFDLDGTLVDTAADIRSAANALLAELDLPALGPRRVRRLIGHGARALFETVLRDAGRQVEKSELDVLADRFLEVYGAGIARESRPYPGVERALDALAGAGARLAVCTNKRDRSTSALLEALGLAWRFHAVATPETAGFAKPDPRHLLAAIEAAGGKVGRAVMVGDSATDVEAARAAGAPVVVVSHGYSTTPPSRLGADALIDDLRALPAVCARLLAGAGESIGRSPAADA